MGGVWGKYAVCTHSIYFKSILILHDFDVVIIENANVQRRRKFYFMSFSDKLAGQIRKICQSLYSKVPWPAEYQNTNHRLSYRVWDIQIYEVQSKIKTTERVSQAQNTMSSQDWVMRAIEAKLGMESPRKRGREVSK